MAAAPVGCTGRPGSPSEPGLAWVCVPAHFKPVRPETLENWYEKALSAGADFDQTLSFNDSGFVLSELLGVPGFEEKVKGFATRTWCNRAQNWPICILHDPEFRGVRREHLIEAGRRVRLKQHIPRARDVSRAGTRRLPVRLFRRLRRAARRSSSRHSTASCRRSHLSARSSATTRDSARSATIERVPAGYGKVAVLDEFAARLGVRRAVDLHRRRQLGRPRDAAREPATVSRSRSRRTSSSRGSPGAPS